MKHNSSSSSVSEVPLASPLMKPQQCHGWPVSGDLLLSALCSLFTVFSVFTVYTCDAMKHKREHSPLMIGGSSVGGWEISGDSLMWTSEQEVCILLCVSMKAVEDCIRVLK